jgi:hypothetical protein
MNLHSIVAGPIGAVNAHEFVKVYHCTGTTNIKGVITPAYERTTVRAQVQAPDESDIKLSDRIAEAEHTKKFYIDAPASTINKVLQSAGDIIERDDGTYWLVVAIKDDFSRAGWLCCICVLQTEPPPYDEEVTDNADDANTDKGIVGS